MGRQRFRKVGLVWILLNGNELLIRGSWKYTRIPRYGYGAAAEVTAGTGEAWESSNFWQRGSTGCQVLLKISCCKDFHN